jgi:hypothetical protein
MIITFKIFVMFLGDSYCLTAQQTHTHSFDVCKTKLFLPFTAELVGLFSDSSGCPPRIMLCWISETEVKGIKQLNKFIIMLYMRVYPKVSRLAAWSENYKWYSSLPLGVVVSLFFESV